MSNIKQIFFDCDNTIVLSENAAFEACADLINELLIDFGIDDRYTNERLIVEFIGQSFRGMMTSLQQKHHFTIPPDRVNYYIKQEEHAVIRELRSKGHPCDGSIEIMQKLHADKNYNLALVSSSALDRVRACIAKTGQDQFIPHNHVYSATTSLHQPATKPDPAVYRHAMETIGVTPEQCVAVEDSKSGALAAIRAKVACIAYVGAYHTNAKRQQVAKMLTDLGCKAVMYHWSEFFDCVEKIERASTAVQTKGPTQTQTSTSLCYISGFELIQI